MVWEWQNAKEHCIDLPCQNELSKRLYEICLPGETYFAPAQCSLQKSELFDKSCEMKDGFGAGMP